tara:strand:+ start:260 stop:1423 length:1164 start_codon:yes stop_codon:yes gene_type:complete
MSNNLDFKKIMYISPKDDKNNVDYYKFNQCHSCKLTFNYKDIDTLKITKGDDDYIKILLGDKKESTVSFNGLPTTNDSVKFILQEILITSPSLHTFDLDSPAQGEVIFVHYNKDTDMYLNIFVILVQHSTSTNDPVTTQIYSCLQQAIINYNTPKQEKKVTCDGFNPQDLLNYEAISKDYIYYLSDKDKTLNVVVSEPVYINQIFTSALQTSNKNYKLRGTEKVTKFDKTTKFFYYTVPEEEQKKQICFGSGPKNEDEIKEYCEKNYSSDSEKKSSTLLESTNEDNIKQSVKKNTEKKSSTLLGGTKEDEIKHSVEKNIEKISKQPFFKRFFKKILDFLRIILKLVIGAIIITIIIIIIAVGVVVGMNFYNFIQHKKRSSVSNLSID